MVFSGVVNGLNPNERLMANCHHAVHSTNCRHLNIFKKRAFSHSRPRLYSVWKSIKHTLPKNGIAPMRLSNILIPKFTSRWSPSASPNILSMFLMTATFCCAIRGWVIWLGVGPACNKRISILQSVLWTKHKIKYKQEKCMGIYRKICIYKSR